MRKISTLIAGLLCLASLPAAASGCRAGTAADAGSQTGYDTAKKAADAWAQHENQVSQSLGDCLGDISTQIIMPQFPNLSEILGKIEQEVCQAAQSEIGKYVPDTIDPWDDLPDIPDVQLSARSPRATLPASPPVLSQPVMSPTSPGDDTDRSETVFSLN